MKEQIPHLIIGIYLAIGGNMPCFAQPEQARREQYLKDSLLINDPKSHRHSISRRVTVKDDTWTDWQERTGELPPDFSQMRSYPFLPDPLQIENSDGKLEPVETMADWNSKRSRIKKEFQHWVSGTVPPPPSPNEYRVEILDDHTTDGVRGQIIELRFGPGHQATMTFEMLIPPGDEPHPVYMTQWNHRAWAQLAVRRGYIGCVYAGADAKDDTQAYQELYPDYDFTGLMRRAWGASRVIDYLLTRPEVDAEKIAITGHSRNGKQSLWAAAFDDRITACISSSSGTGGITPWRFSDPQYTNQTLDDITANASHWFHPRLKFFFGREDKLPVDQNELLALIAPRALLLHYSTVERQLNPWVNEQCYESVKSVYDFLGAGDKIELFPRMGEHAVAARDLVRCIDFLDVQFGRKNIPLPWLNARMYDYSFDEWSVAHIDDRTSAEEVNAVSLKQDYATTSSFAADKAEILKGLDWLLGEKPPGVKPLEVSEGSSGNVDWIYDIIGRPTLQGTEMVNISPYSTLGDYVQATLYLPLDKNGKRRLDKNGKMPVVIYLHQYSYAHGFVVGDRTSGGGMTNPQIFRKLTDGGYAVLAFDMFGFGTRQVEQMQFYDRFPEWSKMGKMIEDISSCVDAMEMKDYIDSERIFLVGNTIGGSIAMMAAAMDDRIAGVAAVAAFSPWRSSNSQYDSLRTYSHHHGFIPRLGFFADKPEEAPVDFAEIMATIAPRPLLVIAPELNRHSDPNAVAETMSSVSEVYKAYDAGSNLQFETPREINRITDPMMDSVVNFLNQSIATKP